MPTRTRYRVTVVLQGYYGVQPYTYYPTLILARQALRDIARDGYQQFFDYDGEPRHYRHYPPSSIRYSKIDVIESEA